MVMILWPALPAAMACLVNLAARMLGGVGCRLISGLIGIARASDRTCGLGAPRGAL